MWWHVSKACSLRHARAHAARRSPRAAVSIPARLRASRDFPLPHPPYFVLCVYLFKYICGMMLQASARKQARGRCRVPVKWSAGTRSGLSLGAGALLARAGPLVTALAGWRPAPGPLGRAGAPPALAARGGSPLRGRGRLPALQSAQYARNCAARPLSSAASSSTPPPSTVLRYRPLITRF